MDHDLKQRLVGAAVITSLAAIFVPMLFDDPIDESGKLIAELTLPEQSVASLEVDKLPANIDDIVNLPATSANKPIKTADSSLYSKTNLERWYVQVGNFGLEENAISLQNKIRQQGFPVTISKVSGSDSGLLYKVRIGPELDRERVEVMKEQMYKLNNIKGMVILESP